MATLTIVEPNEKQKASVSNRTARERIQMLEKHPRPEWFVKVTAPDGKVQWFVRLAITGLCVRRYGPFPSKRASLLFLDSAINVLVDGVMEISNIQGKYQLPKRPLENRCEHYPMIERELFVHAPTLV